MSYILDALKKAEQIREQEESSGAVSFSSQSAVSAKKRALWRYVFTGAVILNVVFFAMWMWMWMAGRPVEVKVPAPETNRFHAPPAVEMSPQISSKVPVNEVVVRRPADKSLSRPRAEANPMTKKETAVRETTAREARGPAFAPKEEQSLLDDSSKKTIAAEVPPPKETQRERPQAVAGKLYGIGELPSDIRHNLPEFRISGHAYSTDARTRVVRINEKILQEGQDLSAGLRLEEIIPDGVILAYQGFRFRVNLK
jgi:general secretion pathway protein B